MAETKEKLVPVTLPFLDDADSPQQEFVSLNFKNYIIKRGETVMVPPEIKDMLDASEKSKQEARKAAMKLGYKDPMKH